MKNIRILALLVIAVFIAEVIMSNGTASFKKGWNSAGNSRENNLSTVNIAINPTDIAPTDSLFNSAIKEDIPYWVTSLETKIEPTFVNKLVIALTVPFVLFSLYGFYCMVRVVISVSRGQVFTRCNANRMRIFVYSMIAVGFGMEIYEYILHQDAVSQIQFGAIELASYELQFSWFSYLLLALFTEIFAAGVKMKEEQDLTI